MSEENKDVVATSSPPVSTDANSESEKSESGETAQPPTTGSKTPDENLYKALAEERRLRKEAEAALDNLQSQNYSQEPPVQSDPVDLSPLEERIQTLEEEGKLKDVYAKYPAIQDSFVEFEQFRTNKPGLNPMDAAVLFLNEKGMIPSKPEPKGLEKPTGGEKEPSQQDGLTAEDLKRMRVENPRKYEAFIQQDNLDIKSLKR